MSSYRLGDLILQELDEMTHNEILNENPNTIGSEYIKEYYHNDEKYTLRYKTNPENYYNDGDQVYLVYENGEQKYLTKEDFIKLHEQYGMLIGFRKLLNKQNN